MKWMVLAASLLLVFGVAAFGGQFSPGAWYAALEKPAWTPPNWLFGPVWTALYLMMGIAAWRVWLRGQSRARQAALAAYAVQLLLNGAWSWLFFGQQRIGLALVDILALLAAIAVCTVLFWRIDRLAGALLVPYLLWVSYASALNFALWRLNT